MSQSGIEAAELSPGNHNDCTYFKLLHDKIKSQYIQYIVADKGYDSDDIRKCIQDFGQMPVIPYKKNRKKQKEIDKSRYKTRNIIERMFGKIKEYRRIATRYDKLDINFFSFIAIAFIVQIIC